MIQKPKHFAADYREQFKDLSMAKVYQYRPPYPAEVFDTLAGLIHGEPRRVLDGGFGNGNIARNLVDRVDRLDAIDFSQHMIEKGKRLPNGDNPRLHWLYPA